MITLDRQKEIQEAVVRVMSKLLAPIDLSKDNQSISFVGLHQILLSIPRDEFIQALKNMNGIYVLEAEPGIIHIPTKHFK